MWKFPIRFFVDFNQSPINRRLITLYDMGKIQVVLEPQMYCDPLNCSVGID